MAFQTKMRAKDLSAVLAVTILFFVATQALEGPNVCTRDEP